MILDAQKDAGASGETMRGKSLIFISALALASCQKEAETKTPDNASAAEKKAHTTSSSATPSAEAEPDGPTGATKLSDRSKEKEKPAQVGERLAGGMIKSPYSSAMVSGAGLTPGSLVVDPTNGRKFSVPEETADPNEVAKPFAVAVPGKPGMVFSPYNNKMVDVTGLTPGMMVADPTYPASEKKYFRVPELAPVTTEPGK